MKLRRTPSIGEAYPSLFEGKFPLLTPQDIQDEQEFLRTQAPEIARNFKKDIVTVELGGRVTRALISKGEDDHVIIIPAEYATGGLDGKDDLDAVMRAQAMRWMINPNATLYYVPNNNDGENNLRLSEDQRRGMLGQNGAPASFKSITDGMMATLESQGLASQKLTGVGNSHGASVITSFAARSDVDMHSISTFLPPDIIEREKRDLLKDFRSEGRNLFKNIEISKLGVEAPFLSQNLLDLMRFVRSAQDKDNQATIGPLLTGKHMEELIQALNSTPGLVVVRGWTPKAAISPAQANAIAGEHLRHMFGERVEDRRITGEFAGATSANVFPISASLARRAYILANAYQIPA